MDASRRVALRDDPERPVAEDRGRYEAADGVVTLRYAADVGGGTGRAKRNRALPASGRHPALGSRTRNRLGESAGFR